MPSRRDKAIAALSGAGGEGSARSDPKATELSEFFLAEVERGVAELEAALRAGDRASARSAAGRLSRATQRVDSPQLSEQAAVLEASLFEDEATVSLVTEKMESLLLLCREAMGGDE